MSLRQEKNYRDYNNLNMESTVAKTYQLMHQNQTAVSVKALRDRFTHSKGNVIRKRLLDFFPILDRIVDDSDPDTKLPQIYHAYQTGEALKTYCKDHDPTQLKENILIEQLFGDEWQQLPTAIRQAYPRYLHELYPDIKNWSWLPLVGFLHDMGKILASPDYEALPQWQVVGDTFPLSAPFAKSNIFYEAGFYKSNNDLTNTTNTATHFGKYQKKCGLNQITMSFGHDEYMFLILNNAIHHLPPHALYLIRFHSFYAWHTPRNGERGYTELANDDDWRLLPLLKAFQRSDLYSKTESLPNIEKLEKQYVQLIEQFVPGRENTHHDLRPAKLKISHLENETFSMKMTKSP